MGAFHRLVEQGEVEPGSVLLVESLDRLSREQVLDALTQFTGLIRAGVKVVTLADRMEYDQASINANFGQLLMSLVIMSRAHEESATKAHRAQAAWSQKRKRASDNGHKLTAKCPSWLKLSDDRKSFTILPEVAQVVNRIFQMRLEGKGCGTIVRTLNANPTAWKPNGRRNPHGGWHVGGVDKILRCRSVIGEFHPHTKTNSKRLPEGDPIPDYYPPVVGKDTFDRVQEALQCNRRTSPGNGGGRTGPVNNLFGHIAKCYYCGGPMAYVCRDPARKISYLVCDTARRGLGCKKSYARYDRFEPLILSYCKGLDPGDILPSNEKMQSELALLKNQLQAVEGALTQVERNIDNLLDNLEIGESVRDRLKARQEQKSQLEAQREALIPSCAHRSKKSSRSVGAHPRVRPT